jgi:hypothetical protein
MQIRAVRPDERNAGFPSASSSGRTFHGPSSTANKRTSLGFNEVVRVVLFSKKRAP